MTKYKLSELVKLPSISNPEEYPPPLRVLVERENAMIKCCDVTVAVDEEILSKIIQTTVHGIDCAVRDYPINKLSKTIAESLPYIIKEVE